MFDISFWELLIVIIIALIVIGPKRLPTIARTLGHWLYKGKQFKTHIQNEINQQLKIDELKANQQKAQKMEAEAKDENP